MVDGDGSDNEDENDDDEENEVDEEAAKAVTILAPFADLLNHNSALNNARLHMQHPGAFQMVVFHYFSFHQSNYIPDLQTIFCCPISD